jgi:hypothetical protein
MKKIIASLFGAFLLMTSVQAQFMQDINGRVVNEMTYTDVEGSPYLFEEWNTGIVKAVENEKVFDGLKMRYDAYKDEVEYEKNGKMYRLSSEISAFTLPTGDALYEFRRGFPAIGDQTEKSFYRVLSDGNTKVLKRFEMKMREEKPYNSATVTKRFDLDEQLYVLKNGTMYPVKTNDRKGILKLVSDEKNLMNYVIKEEQLNFRTEDDIVKLLEEYDAYKAGRKGKNE